MKGWSLDAPFLRFHALLRKWDSVVGTVERNMFWAFLIGLVALGWASRKELRGVWGFILGPYFCVLGGLCILEQHLSIQWQVKIVLAIATFCGQCIILRCSPDATKTTAQRLVLFFLLGSSLSGLTQWCTESTRAVSAMTANGETIQYTGEKIVDCWFNAISAICVTGLTSTDFSQFTLAGQIVTVITILAGGMGTVFLTAFVGLLIRAGLSTREGVDELFKDSLNVVTPELAWKLARQIVFFFLFFIGGSTVILGSYYQWLAPRDAIEGANPWWWALFHTSSAWCNAGFSLNKANLMNCQEDPVVNGVIAWLITIGGLGFPVLLRCELWLYRLWAGDRYTADLIKDLEAVEASRLQTEICMKGTIALQIIGTLLTLVWEYDRLPPSTFAVKVMTAWFHSVSARTAGFNTVDLSTWHSITHVLYMILMFIGACPQGTAGGVKITTLRIFGSWLWPSEPFHHVQVHARGEIWLVERNTMSAALRCLAGAVFTVVAATFALFLTERAWLSPADTMKIAFEIVSAFGTVGLSLGVPEWMTSFSAIMSIDGKIVLMIVMLVGRMGPLAILAIIPFGQRNSAVDLEAAERLKIVQVG